KNTSRNYHSQPPYHHRHHRNLSKPSGSTGRPPRKRRPSPRAAPASAICLPPRQLMQLTCSPFRAAPALLPNCFISHKSSLLISKERVAKPRKAFYSIRAAGALILDERPFFGRIEGRKRGARAMGGWAAKEDLPSLVLRRVTTNYKLREVNFSLSEFKADAF
ncbi:hypothetical protein GWI33_006262, partial [Rhynchophorus ferrugineus]